MYLSRSGKKWKFSKLISSSLFDIINIYKFSGLDSYNYINNWKVIQILLTFTSLHNSNFSKISFLKRLDLTSYSNIKYEELTKSNEFTINNLLYQNFKKFNYLFSFYIYKVDKQIYKNSRGKSGKYTFVWKYVAPYKRHFLIMHWITKEIRIASGKTLQERVKNTLNNFIFNTHSTWIWKIKKFSLNYVYFNLRRTLGETCKTSMR
jgi:hypothetical protein